MKTGSAAAEDLAALITESVLDEELDFAGVLSVVADVITEWVASSRADGEDYEKYEKMSDLVHDVAKKVDRLDPLPLR